MLRYVLKLQNANNASSSTARFVPIEPVAYLG